MTRVQNIELKYGNRTLSNVWRYKRVRLALADFDSIICNKLK